MTHFWLGTHQPHWLGYAGVPLFVSRRTLCRRKSFPRAVAPWALDSGGFTELQQYGRWTVSAADYAREVRRFADEIGMLSWAAPRDWMCEPAVISGGRMGPLTFAGTGLSVAEHQRRTVVDYLELRSIAPDLPIIPVLQGWTIADYLHCVELYQRAGVDLWAAQVVGVGSVCRRQSEQEGAQIMATLGDLGLRLHGFGFKRLGLRAAAPWMASADSLAWSAAARFGRVQLPGCTHANCANCIRYALQWRDDVLSDIANCRSAVQLPLLAA